MNHKNMVLTSYDRIRRSRLYVPGNQPEKILKAKNYSPDCIILDLEDAIPFMDKEKARVIVRNALRVVDFQGIERMVRINSSDIGLKDLEYIVPQYVHAVLVPKVESADQF